MKLRDFAAVLRQRDRFLLITHKNPDGDTVGSAAALCSALRRLGKTAYLYPNPGFVRKQLPYVEPYLAPKDYVPECCVSVDIAAPGLFPQGFEGPVELGVDHHPSNSHFAAHELVDAEKASCGEIVFSLIRSLCGEVSKEEATLLYIAVSTDTGCFQYANTDYHTLAAASELLRLGAESFAVNLRFFRKVSPARLKLEGMIYSHARFYREGKIGVALVTRDMLRESGAAEDDLDDLAGLIGRCEGSLLNITIRELENGDSRVSVRSGREVNSSEICAAFGGGGHAMAAGCTIPAPPEKAERLLLDVVEGLWP